jgi:Flp pilus assembly protein TadD
LEIRPNYAEAHCNFGVALAGRGQVDEAIAQYRKALEIKPDIALVRCNLGVALADRGEIDEAIAQYRKALEIKPDYVEAHTNLGAVLAEYRGTSSRVTDDGRLNEAIAHYRKALEFRPDYAVAHDKLGYALTVCGNVGEALVHYRKALEINPDFAEALNNTAWILATHPDSKFRDGPQAVNLALRALKLSTTDTGVLDTLAAAYAEAGRFAEAVQTARKAVDLAKQQGHQALADSIQAKLRLYEVGTPFHEPPQASPQSR